MKMSISWSSTRATACCRCRTERIKTGTAYSILSDYVKSQNPENRLFIVHRLDRDTSGLMMFAKSKGIQEQMQHNWHNMVLERKYVAVVEGQMEQPEGDGAVVSGREFGLSGLLDRQSRGGAVGHYPLQGV